jgi:ABC-type Na+ efflux pump permease subunit
MSIWTLAKKELRLLVRDRRAALILVAMPLVFILTLGLLLGENFGQKPDDRLRVSIVDEDDGFTLDEALCCFAMTPQPGGMPAALTFAAANRIGRFPYQPWSRMVRRDLAETAGIRVEVIDSRDEAQELVAEHRRAAVLIFEPGFSQRIAACSFLTGGINPFHRDGVYLDRIDVNMLTDSKQPGGAAIIEQVAQVSLMRVILPWMIGRAFERLSDPEFIEILGREVNLPVPTRWRFLAGKDKISLSELLVMAASNDPRVAESYKQKVGGGVQNALREQFRKYELTGKTWSALTRSLGASPQGTGLPILATTTVGLTASPQAPAPLLASSVLYPEQPRQAMQESPYVNLEGSGPLKRGAARYQLLVPSYTVMFAFFLVMTVGWLFVAERREGTLKRLRAAPITRSQILLGKLIPCFLLSLGQGILLLVAGRLLFGMRWGPEQWSLGEQIGHLFPVIFATSLAAMGLALLVAVLARTEIQVALYGALPALVLALIGGCVLPREMMPEQTQQLSLLTPQGWALSAYRELLDPNPTALPNLAIVYRACVVLACFGLGFLALAWWFMKLED